MNERRGWVLTRDGRRHEVPDALLDEDQITWPPTLQETKPGQPVKYITADDLYRRHEVVEGKVYLYLAPNRELRDVPEEEIEKLRGPKPR